MNNASSSFDQTGCSSIDADVRRSSGHSAIGKKQLIKMTDKILRDFMKLEKLLQLPLKSKNNGAPTSSDKELLLPDAEYSSSDSDSSDEEFQVVSSQSSTRAAPPHETRTTSGTQVHFLKANLFTGLLAMPKAISHFGLLAGILGIFIIGGLYLYCIHLLLQINRAVAKRIMVDRKIKQLKELESFIEKKRKKALKKAAKGCGNAAKVSVDSANWKTRFAEDFEIGTSSKSDLNSESKGSNAESRDQEDSLESDKDNSKGKGKYTKGIKKKTSAAKKDIAERNSESKGSNAERDQEDSLESDKDNSKKGKGKYTKGIKKKTSAAKKDIAERNSELKGSNAESRDQEEDSLESDKDNSKKKSTEVKEEIIEMEEDLPPPPNENPERKSTEVKEEIIEMEEDLPPPPNENPESESTERRDEDSETYEEIIVKTLPYSKLVKWSFHYGVDMNKSFGKFMTFYVDLLTIATHVGCCCVCFLFISETLGELSTKGAFSLHTNSFKMVAFAIPVIICLSFIPDRQEMTAVSTIAILLQLVAIAMMIYFLFTGDHKEPIDYYIAPYQTWYLYFGIIFYAFEGTGVSLHLESHMERQRDFDSRKGILNLTLLFIIPLFAVVGGLGYWKYGSDVDTSVTFNFPEERITDLVQGMTLLGILLTYPFHLSCALKPIRKVFIDESLSERTKFFMDVVLRIIFVLSTYTVAALTPYLELQLTVLGSVSSCFLILFVPTFMSLNSYQFLPDLSFSKFRIVCHLVIFLVGFAGTAIGSYTTLVNLSKYYPNATIFE